MKRWSLILAATVSLAAGCSTTTTMHYDLKPSGEAPAPQNNSMIRYQLASTTVPESLDVETLIVRQPNNSLMVLSHDKWVAPLSEVLQNALSATLTQSLGTPPMPANMLSTTNAKAQVAQVFVDMQQFEMQPAKLASVGALWQINMPDKQDKQGQVITCYSTLSQPVNPGVAALVAAQQMNLQQVGQQIAATLKTGIPPQNVSCQTQKS